MSNEQSSFKVTDRRLFNADGTPRETLPEERPEPTPTAATAPEPAAATTEEQKMPASPTESAAQTAAEDEGEEIPGADDPASFANFLMSIASNAAATLGMMEHPVTRKREVDLELSKHWIDVLGMLEQKTRGNLSAQEKKLLEGLLADLRMQYVSLTHSAQPKGQKPLTGSDIIGG